jgi:hypothetical protein
MMDRRVFLKLTGLAAVAGASQALPALAAPSPAATLAGQAPGRALVTAPSRMRLAVLEPGTYRISGRVRLQEPLVEISGITHRQQISWSDRERPERPVAAFTTFEHFDRPGMTPEIHVRGGRLEALAIIPVDLE